MVNNLRSFERSELERKLLFSVLVVPFIWLMMVADEFIIGVKVWSELIKLTFKVTGRKNGRKH